MTLKHFDFVFSELSGLSLMGIMWKHMLPKLLSFNILLKACLSAVCCFCVAYTKCIATLWHDLIYLSCVSTFQEHYVQTLNSVSHTDVNFFLCGFDCKKINESKESQFY